MILLNIFFTVSFIAAYTVWETQAAALTLAEIKSVIEHTQLVRSYAPFDADVLIQLLRDMNAIQLRLMETSSFIEYCHSDVWKKIIEAELRLEDAFERVGHDRRAFAIEHNILTDKITALELEVREIPKQQQYHPIKSSTLLQLGGVLASAAITFYFCGSDSALV